MQTVLLNAFSRNIKNPFPGLWGTDFSFSVFILILNSELFIMIELHNIIIKDILHKFRSKVQLLGFFKRLHGAPHRIVRAVEDM